MPGFKLMRTGRDKLALTSHNHLDSTHPEILWHYYQVDGTMNGKPCRLTVNTGTFARTDVMSAKKIPLASKRLCDYQDKKI